MIRDCGLRPLASHDLPEVYRLMVVQEFPSVPDSYDGALVVLERVSGFGLWDSDVLVAVFLLGEPEDGVAFLDVLCAPAYHGKWARRDVLLALYTEIFGVRALRAVWVQPCNKRALKACLTAGFVATTPLDGPEPVLLMTRLTAAAQVARLIRQRKEIKDGIAF